MFVKGFSGHSGLGFVMTGLEYTSSPSRFEGALEQVKARKDTFTTAKRDESRAEGEALRIRFNLSGYMVVKINEKVVDTRRKEEAAEKKIASL